MDTLKSLSIIIMTIIMILLESELNYCTVLNMITKLFTAASVALPMDVLELLKRVL